ncbi:FAD-dependent oxidoreductase [Clostridium butyricum]
MDMNERLIRVPVREQDPKVRATNFEEVCLGYNEEEAVKEASRCLNCKNAQCRKGCPVSIDIPAFIAKLKDSDFEGAAKEIAKYSALPAVCGRVCPQEKQCEGKCVLGIKGQSVSIGKLERFTADWAAAHNVDLSATEPKKGIKVAVIGSGPAGLTCAGDLAKKGYEVTIFEALHKAGGVLEYGIPEFRLPKEKVVANEVNNIKKLGVKIETNVIIGRTITIEELFEEEGFEAVLRLGSESHIVYRRGESELPARAEEVHHAKEEGVIFDVLTNPTEILVDENGWVKGMKCVRMELGEPDASGRRSPVEIPGSEFVMDVDTVIMSLGTSPNPLISSTTEGLEINKRRCIVAEEETGLTTKEGVYAGGDAVTGAATVILAMGAGKKAAAAIDEYLQK